MNLAEKVTIVALTAYANPEYQQQGIDIGMARILTKPAKKTDIVEVILKFCSNLPIVFKSVKSYNVSRQSVLSSGKWAKSGLE